MDAALCGAEGCRSGHRLRCGNAGALGLSYGDYVGRLVANSPLPQPVAERRADRAALLASNDRIAALSTDLVARWTTEHWLDQSGSQKIVRTFVFAPDGSYRYTIATCRSGDCVLNGQESGSVQAADGMLSLTPETGSQDGPRGWRYVVGRSEVGDVQLHLALSDGQTDIFYYG